VKNAVMPS